MLTGGEPLLHGNLWALCDRLRQHGIRITLVTTGLLIAPHAVRDRRERRRGRASRSTGRRDVHDAIRRVTRRLRRASPAASRRSTTRRRACRTRSRDRSCSARNFTLACPRPSTPSVASASTSCRSCRRRQLHRVQPARRPWAEERASDRGASEQGPRVPARRIDPGGRDSLRPAVDDGFIVGGTPSLERIHAYYAALAGPGPFPRVRCNAPWVSAVMEPTAACVRASFTNRTAPPADRPLDEQINSPEAVAFRRGLNVETNDTCRRCVCTLSLGAWSDA